MFGMNSSDPTLDCLILLQLSIRLVAFDEHAVQRINFFINPVVKQQAAAEGTDKPAADNCFVIQPVDIT